MQLSSCFLFSPEITGLEFSTSDNCGSNDNIVAKSVGTIVYAISIAKDISALGNYFWQSGGVPCNSPKNDGCALKLSDMRTIRPRLRPRNLRFYILMIFDLSICVSLHTKCGPNIWKVFLVFER